MRKEKISSLGATNELKGMLPFKISHPVKRKVYNKFRQKLVINAKFSKRKKI